METLHALAPLQAYAIGMAGGLGGIEGFFVDSYGGLPPLIWFALLRRLAGARVALAATLFLATNAFLFRFGYAATTDLFAIALQAGALATHAPLSARATRVSADASPKRSRARIGPLDAAVTRRPSP